MQPILVSINEVAAMLGVSRRTAYAMRARPGFPRPVVLAQRSIRYRTAEVEAFVAGLAAEQAQRPEPPELADARGKKRPKSGAGGGDFGGFSNPQSEHLPGEPRRAKAGKTDSTERSSVELENSNSPRSA